jgi:hypothetical protein
VNGQIRKRDIRDQRIDVDNRRPPIAPVVIFVPILTELGEDDSRAISILTDEADEAPFDKHFFAIRPLLDQNDYILRIVLWNGIEGLLNRAEMSAAVFGDDDLGALGTDYVSNTEYQKGYCEGYVAHPLPHHHQVA